MIKLQKKKKERHNTMKILMSLCHFAKNVTATFYQTEWKIEPKFDRKPTIRSLNWVEVSKNVPEAATSLTSTPFSWAMNPRTEKMTNPAKILVAQLIRGTRNESLHCTSYITQLTGQLFSINHNFDLNSLFMRSYWHEHVNVDKGSSGSNLVISLPP